MKNEAPYIRTFDDPILKVVCEPLELKEQDRPARNMSPFISQEDGEWIETLKDLCRRAKNPTAAGLAAPQVGWAKRVIVTHLKDRKGKPQLRVMINPVIKYFDFERDTAREECLSYPGRSAMVERQRNIEVTWFSLSGVWATVRYSDFEARVIQHEVDHLDGICRVGEYVPPPASPAKMARPMLAAAIAGAILAGGLDRGRR